MCSVFSPQCDTGPEQQAAEGAPGGGGAERRGTRVGRGASNGGKGAGGGFHVAAAPVQQWPRLSCPDIPLHWRGSSLTENGRGSATKHILYFKCHRKYYNGSVTKNMEQ